MPAALAVLILGFALVTHVSLGQVAPAPPVHLDVHERGLEPQTADVGGSFALDVPDPNPFSHYTRVSLHLPVRKLVRLVVMDRAGNVVHLLHQGELPAGRHAFIYSPDDTLPEGLYRIVMKTPGRSFSQPVKLLRN